MAMDALDWVAVVGVGGVVALAAVADLEPIFLSTILGGFVLSLAVWRFYEGVVWEAAGWLAWVGAAVSMAFDAGDGGSALTTVLFVTATILGLALLLGSRLGLFPEGETGDGRHQ